MILSPSGKICICPGAQLLFMCQASTVRNPQTDWLIHFEVTGLSNVTHSYVSGDPLGEVQIDSRNGYNFTFNLTYNNEDNNTSLLTSTLMFTNTNTTSPLHQATISCSNGERNEEAVLYICTGKVLYNMRMHLAKLYSLGLLNTSF